MFFIILHLFDNQFIVEKCILKKYKIKIIINNDLNNYEFVNLMIAQKICETLNCVLIKLIKYKTTKNYDKKKILLSFILFILK